MRPVNDFALPLAGWLTIALLAAQVSVARDQHPAEPEQIDAVRCVACISAVVANELSGISYRGRLDDKAISLAVLLQDGREQVVSVGGTIAGAWTVVAIDAEAVSLQHVVSGVRQRLWFGGGDGQVASGGSPPYKPELSLNWNVPSTVDSGSEFSVVLSIPDLDVKWGDITLAYDPTVLEVVEATGDWEDFRGLTRLRIEDSGDSHVLAEIAFRVIAQEPTVTELRADHVELVDAGGEPLHISPHEDPRIEIVAARAAPVRNRSLKCSREAPSSTECRTASDLR